jgi:hypothetical protein
MDPQSFDRFVAAASRRPTRRTTLRLLATGVLGSLLPGRTARAQKMCPEGTTYCPDQDSCCDLLNDAGHCGACHESCTLGHSCGEGSCRFVAGCASGLTDCGGTCVDTWNDPWHCGGCNQYCDTRPCNESESVCFDYACANGVCGPRGWG